MTIEPLGNSNDHLYLSFQLFFFFRNSLLFVTMKFTKGNETPIWDLYTFTTSAVLKIATVCLAIKTEYIITSLHGNNSAVKL